jgi:hypothetical protein
VGQIVPSRDGNASQSALATIQATPQMIIGALARA